MSVYKTLFSEAAEKELMRIETEKAKEVVRLIDHKEYVFEVEKAEDKESKEVAPEEHSQFPEILKKVRNIVADLIGRKLSKQEVEEAELSNSYLDDFRDQFTVFDRDEVLTEAGAQLEGIMKKTIAEIRKAFDLKDPPRKEEVKKPPQSTKMNPKKDPKKK